LAGLLAAPETTRRTRAGEPVPPGEGPLLILDADDPAADDAKRGLHAWCHESGPDGSAWLGGTGANERAFRLDSPPPMVVSFYTLGTAYEAEAEGLRAGCESLGIACDVRGVAPRGSWEANCAMKAEFVRERWREHAVGVVWVDADARFARPPDLLRAGGFDFAVHRCDGWQFASGTVCFWPTPRAGALLDAWADACAADPRRWDQVSLDLAWERTLPGGLRTLWLPQAYTKIFDRPPQDPSGSDPVITHHQASRRLKATISTETPTPVRPPDRALMRARRASRPRTPEELAG
jgi:hypothetical protein